jgi:hypothetical protein
LIALEREVPPRFGEAARVVIVPLHDLDAVSHFVAELPRVTERVVAPLELFDGRGEIAGRPLVNDLE